jgi:hypothetical protein
MVRFKKLTLCRSNLNPYCLGKKAAFFFSGHLTLSLLMSYICGVSKTFGEWYQKTNRTEDTNELTLLAFKIIIILHNTRLATFINLPELSAKVSLEIDRRTTVTRCWISAARGIFCFVCFLVPFTERFRHTTYMELLVNPEILTSYI